MWGRGGGGGIKVCGVRAGRGEGGYRMCDMGTGLCGAE